MTRIRVTVRIIRFAALFAFCISNFAFSSTAGQMMSVQVKVGQMRSSPSFMGKIIAELGYGDQVMVLEEQGGWHKVSVPGKGEGWMHDSALSSKKIVMKAGAANVAQTADSKELALAGKGFNKQVESEYKAKNPNLSFAWVDKMEAMKVSPHEMQKFLRDGGVSPGGAR